MKKQKRALQISKVFVVLLMVALAALFVLGPWLADWITERSSNMSTDDFPLFLATLYVGGALVGVILYFLYRLLYNIGKGMVFTAQNVRYMRNMAICFFAGGAVCCAAGFYYVLWWPVGAVALAGGLFVRVIRDMLAEAILLKEENDFTI